MDARTRQYTEKIFLNVSRAAARTKIYALRAEQDDNKPLAKLFRAIAISEETQALRLLLQLRGQTGKNEQNCKTAFENEIPSLITDYEEAEETAEKAGERAMQSIFLQSTKVHHIHLNLKKSLDNSSSKDSVYHVCTFCGFIMEDHAPHKCPICTASTSRFTKI
ncbi:MAG: hypothetical protein U9R57_09300 [Thermodesulfobacteriota bacterium]|nr:hypothetical protein [Thermodesulfobacteriota bacterium]